MTTALLEQNVESVRAFTRFYTRKAGVLNELLLDSNFGLTEARILYELSREHRTSAKTLSKALDLDPGYVSRVIKKFDKSGYITRKTSDQDKRQQHILLTKKGQEEFKVLNDRSASLFKNLIKGLNLTEQSQLLASMNQIQAILTKSPDPTVPFLIRPHRPGDMGWIIQAHGRIYSEEFGWDNSFEALVAEIAAAFLRNYDKQSECCWIAEKNGQTIGSAMIVREDALSAKLRLVIVDPVARGLGVGLSLVNECILFAKRSGYSNLTLWTNDNLHAAIAIYIKLGFELISEEPHHSFGKDLVGQYWKLDFS